MKVEDIGRPPEEVVTRPPSTSRSSKSAADQGLFGKFFSFLVGGSDPDRERKHLLRDVARLLKASHHKFYRPKTEEALPSMAKYFYDLYTIVGAAQMILDHADSSSVLRTIVIERSFSPEQVDLRARVTEQAIAERAKQVEMSDLQAEVKENLVALLAGFDAARVKEINASYNLLSILLDAIHFDYYFLLKKFDANLPERDFKYQPHFETIQIEYLIDDLKDFLALAYLFDPKTSWDFLFDVLKEYRGVEIVKKGEWQRYLRAIFDVRRAHIFELVVQHATRDPRFKPKLVLPNEKIVEDYLSKIKSQAEITVQKIAHEKQSKKLDALTKAVFGTTAVARTKNYTEKYNALFTQRLLGGFTHVAPINYLKAFLVDYFKNDIREIVDLLVVRGKWSTPLMSQQLSESFHILLQTSDELLQFDDSLADEAELGIRLKGLIWKSDRDKAALKSLRQLLKEINDKAFSMILRAAQSLVVTAKSFKIVLEDYDKKQRELIINWKEIEVTSDGKIRAKIVETYKRIYYFVQLLQLFAKKEAA